MNVLLNAFKTTNEGTRSALINFIMSFNVRHLQCNVLTLSFGIFNDKFEHVFASRDPCNKTFSYCQLSAQYRGVFRKLLDIYVPYTDTPGSWFLLAKCLKNTCWGATFQVKMQVIDLYLCLKRYSSTGVFKHFDSKNQLPGFYNCGTLVENGFRKGFQPLTIFAK